VRRVLKQGEKMEGTITNLKLSYGFVRGEGDDSRGDHFFHRSACSVPFESLVIGKRLATTFSTTAAVGLPLETSTASFHAEARSSSGSWARGRTCRSLVGMEPVGSKTFNVSPMEYAQ
jgi:hypothetical protein